MEKKDLNIICLIGFILSLFLSIPGFIVSALGLKQLEIYDEKGKGLAIAGLIISSIKIAIILFFLFTVIIYDDNKPTYEDINKKTSTKTTEVYIPYVEESE